TRCPRASWRPSSISRPFSRRVVSGRGSIPRRARSCCRSWSGRAAPGRIFPMQPADLYTLGWWCLQDWDDTRALRTKHLVGAMRRTRPQDPEDVLDTSAATEGHVLGGLHWEESHRQYVDAWWLTPPAVSYHVPVLPSGDDGDTTTRDDADAAAAQPTPSWYPLEKLDTPDWRLVGKNFELPEWCATDQRWPSGWVGTLLAGTASAERSPQEEILL